MMVLVNIFYINCSFRTVSVFVHFIDLSPWNLALVGRRYKPSGERSRYLDLFNMFNTSTLKLKFWQESFDQYVPLICNSPCYDAIYHNIIVIVVRWVTYLLQISSQSKEQWIVDRRWWITSTARNKTGLLSWEWKPRPTWANSSSRRAMFNSNT
jgi:hypothetical protein